MTPWLSLSYREYSIEEEDSLLRPICEIRLCTGDSEIRLQFFEYITKTRLYLVSV
jgi:hypothetical protein